MELHGHFNYLVELDLFIRWRQTWVMLLDSATRFKVVSHLNDMTATSMFKALLRET